MLHDDAFIINSDTCASIALEPTYFDKTADYPVDSPDNKYLLTAQNCSATLDEDGKVVLVTEDVRNGNGRAIKSSSGPLTGWIRSNPPSTLFSGS